MANISYLTKAKAENIALFNNRTDAEWTYKAVEISVDVWVVQVYDENNELLGCL